MENRGYIPVYIKQTSTIPSLFVNLRVVVDRRSDDVVISFMEYRKVRDTELLISDPAFREAQSGGKLLLVVVPRGTSSCSTMYMCQREVTRL